MAYMDIGNIYSQLYRKPRYTQIGATRVYEPMRINLDQMYGQRYEQTQMPTAPTAPTYTPPISTGAGMPNVGEGVTEDYLLSHGWKRTETITGEETMFPDNPTEGMIYDDPSGKRYIWLNGSWWSELSYGGQTFKSQYANYTTSTTNPISYNLWLASVLWTSEYYNNSDQKNLVLNELRLQGLTNAQIIEKVKEFININISKFPNLTQAQKDVYNNIISKLEGELGIEYDPVTGEVITTTEEVVIYEDWTKQLQDLLEQIESGEISYIDEYGNIDLSALRDSDNMMADWLADVLEQSYQTGSIAGDIINYNPETGEYELSPELQTMEEYIGLQNEEVIKEWQQFNRQLALNAIASGHSLNSGFYSEVLASNLADYTMNVTNQIASVMMGEIEAQYQYIANSMKQALIDAGRFTDATIFEQEMQTQYEAYLEQYREQIELLAQQVGETEGARRGQIMTALMTFMTQIALMFI